MIILAEAVVSTCCKGTISEEYLLPKVNLRMENIDYRKLQGRNQLLKQRKITEIMITQLPEIQAN